MSTEAAAAHWYDTIYLPVLRLIRAEGILRHLPEWTEADLYALVSEHRQELEDALGWEVDLPAAVADFADTEAAQADARSLWRDVAVYARLAEGPSLANWRKAQWRERAWERERALPREERLFADYLVAVRGTASDWRTLEQAIWQAQLEGDRLLGLHVVSRPQLAESAAVEAVRDKFHAMCQAGGVDGEFSVTVGRVSDQIIERAPYADLVITTLVHPPGTRALERLSHGFNKLVQRCPRPLLAFPSGGAPSLLDRPLLAYDGSPKAWEALFVTAYLAARWPADLTVVTVVTDYTPASALDEAREYLEEHGIRDARYILRDRPIADAILSTAETYKSNALIMGGFGFRPLKHLVLGSTVDIVLRHFRQPILICR
jgi:nucleotide-binding universal stress UspA family protein